MKPILFNTEMVQAILDGRKTATRRVVKKKYSNTHLEMFTNKYGTRLIELQDDVEGETHGKNLDGSTWHKLLGMREVEYDHKPYKIGDILYVRETWCHGADTVECLFDENIKCDDIFYKASWDKENYVKWRPSIHMPREAARLFLKITNVRVERLQDMKNEDCLKEGINSCVCMNLNHALTKFKLLWDSTIKKEQAEQYSWMANPWVWVVEFERVERQGV